MPSMPTSTAAYTLKNAFFNAAVELFAEDAAIVSFGHPGPLREQDDIIAFTTVRSEQEPGPISATLRSRNEYVYLHVTVSCWRAGEDNDDQAPSDAVYDYLGRLENYVRTTDTTLGGNCQWCFLTEHLSEGATDRQVLATGRLVEAEGIFKAFVRITN